MGQGDRGVTLRIGMVAPEFPPDVGGVQTYSYGLAEALAAVGLEVTVFTRRDRAVEPVPAGCRREAVLRLRRRLDRAVLQRTDIDAWHATNAAYAWIAMEDPRPVVVSVHGNDFLKPYVLVERPDFARFGPLAFCARRLRPLEERVGRRSVASMLNRALPHANRILTNSRYTEAALLDRIPACRGRTTVGLVGVAPEFLRWRPDGTAEHIAHRLITVSRLSEPRKNVDRVLRALAQLQQKHEFVYTIVGDGPDAPRLKTLAEELGLGERVRFLGRIAGQKLREELTASGLFVLTSSVLPDSHEGFGIVYLEANACGTPVLAARQAGAVEAVAEDISGFFVDEPSVEALRAALDAHLDGRHRFDADACRAHAARFTWRRVAEAALPWYEADPQHAAGGE